MGKQISGRQTPPHWMRCYRGHGQHRWKQKRDSRQGTLVAPEGAAPSSCYQAAPRLLAGRNCSGAQGVLIYSLNKSLLSTSCVPGSGDTAENTTAKTLAPSSTVRKEMTMEKQAGKKR